MTRVASDVGVPSTGLVQSWHVLVFPTIYIIFTGLWQILAGLVIIFAEHVNFQFHVPDGHINQMLNIKPWFELKIQSQLCITYEESLPNYSCKICLKMKFVFARPPKWDRMKIRFVYIVHVSPVLYPVIYDDRLIEIHHIPSRIYKAMLTNFCIMTYEN